MTRIEVERKRELSGAADDIVVRLATLRYQRHAAFTEVDTYYSRPDTDYLMTVECLRVRQRDGFAEITYKPASDPVTHSRHDIIAKRETNVILSGADQADAANAFLAAVGMTFLARVEKSRTLYCHPRHEGVTISLDAIAGLGVFVETEIQAADTADAATLLAELEHQLGLTDHPIVSLPYRDLVLHHAGQPVGRAMDGCHAADATGRVSGNQSESDAPRTLR